MKCKLDKSIKLVDLLKGIVPKGWTSVFDKQPNETGVHSTIRLIDERKICSTERNRFVKACGVEVWQEGYLIEVLAWR